MIPKNPTSLSSATCMQRRRMLATKRSRWKRSSTSTTIPLISSSTMSSSSSPPLLLLGIKPLTWFQDNKGSKADYKVLFVKIAQTPSNKYLKVLARCTITQKEMELLLWNNDKKDIDRGAVVTTFNDPANPLRVRRAQCVRKGSGCPLQNQLDGNAASLQPRRLSSIYSTMSLSSSILLPLPL